MEYNLLYMLSINGTEHWISTNTLEKQNRKQNKYTKCFENTYSGCSFNTSEVVFPYQPRNKICRRTRVLCHCVTIAREPAVCLIMLLRPKGLKACSEAEMYAEFKN